MIDYIIIEPSDPNNKKRAFKFPFVSAEILSSESYAIINAFFPPKKALRSSIDDDDNVTATYPENHDADDGIKERPFVEEEDNGSSLLDKLFKFLEIKPVNPVLSGYFLKIVTNLLTRCPDKMIKYVQEHEKHLVNIIEGLQSRSMAEIVLKILGSEQAKAITFTESIQALMTALTDKFSNVNTDVEELANLSFVWCSLLTDNRAWAIELAKQPNTFTVLFDALSQREVILFSLVTQQLIWFVSL